MCGLWYRYSRQPDLEQVERSNVQISKFSVLTRLERLETPVAKRFQSEGNTSQKLCSVIEELDTFFSDAVALNRKTPHPACDAAPKVDVKSNAKFGASIDLWTADPPPLPDYQRLQTANPLPHVHVLGASFLRLHLLIDPGADRISAVPVADVKYIKSMVDAEGNKPQVDLSSPGNEFEHHMLSKSRQCHENNIPCPTSRGTPADLEMDAVSVPVRAAPKITARRKNLRMCPTIKSRITRILRPSSYFGIGPSNPVWRRLARARRVPPRRYSVACIVGGIPGVVWMRGPRLGERDGPNPTACPFRYFFLPPEPPKALLSTGINDDENYGSIPQRLGCRSGELDRLRTGAPSGRGNFGQDPHHGAMLPAANSDTCRNYHLDDLDSSLALMDLHNTQGDLPQELVDAILAEVDDPASLKACSLVESRFRVPSQRILLDRITLSGLSKVDHSHLENYGAVATYITTLKLQLRLPAVDIDSLQWVLRRVENVCRFTLHGRGPVGQGFFWDDLPSVLSQVLLDFMSRQHLHR
ncbi:hypothetical protein C8R45DRAFT_1073189, partial [Mycena sanguinolenta]